MAVKRLKDGENLEALAKELGVNRRSLYRWLNEVEITTDSREPDVSKSELRRQVKRLSLLLSERTLEVDFFRGALQKVEARRQRKENSGEKASTTKSGK
jgi:transposase-like protein